MLPDRLPARVALLAQQFLDRDQHAGGAIAALKSIPIAEGLLEIGDFAAVGQPLDRLDDGSVRLNRKNQTASHDVAVKANGTCSAYPVLASKMGAGETKMVAQKIGEMRARRNVSIHVLVVDHEGDGDGSNHADAFLFIS
jgi:hypothetical protein